MTDIDIEHLIAIVADGVYVLHTLEGVPLTKAQCQERGRNIATQVIVEFELRRLPGVEGVPERIDEGLAHPLALPAMKIKEWARLDFDTPLIEGRPIGHTWSCQCTACHTYKQTRRSQ